MVHNMCKLTQPGQGPVELCSGYSHCKARHLALLPCCLTAQACLPGLAAFLLCVFSTACDIEELLDSYLYMRKNELEKKPMKK